MVNCGVDRSGAGYAVVSSAIISPDKRLAKVAFHNTKTGRGEAYNRSLPRLGPNDLRASSQPIGFQMT